MGHVWMRHREHRGTAQIADEAVEQFAALGWEPCDEPESANPVLAGYVPPIPTVELPPADEPAPTGDDTDPQE